MAAPIARIILFSFNFLFFVNGVLLLSFGIVGVANPTALTNFISWIPGVSRMAVIIDIPSVVVSGSVFMIVLGSVMLVFGFLGCAGVAFSSKWMLFFYWILLSALLIAEIALIIYAAVSPTAMSGHVKQVMLTSLHNSFEPVYISGTAIRLPSNVVAVAWVAMQFEASCCGVNNASDYSSFTWNNTFTLPSGETVKAVLPVSCCTMKVKGVVPDNTNVFVNLSECLPMQGYYYTEGCYASVHTLLVQYSYIPIGICSCVIAIELVAISLAIHLWRLKSSKKEMA